MHSIFELSMKREQLTLGKKYKKPSHAKCQIHGSVAMSGLIKCECFEVLLPFTVLP